MSGRRTWMDIICLWGNEMDVNKKKGSIRLRLILVFTLSSCVVLFANIFMYYNINKSINTIDEVYRSNVSLNELISELSSVHGYVYEYLNTKSSESLENYYRSEQTYRNLISELNGAVSDNEIMLMQSYNFV